MEVSSATSMKVVERAAETSRQETKRVEVQQEQQRQVQKQIYVNTQGQKTGSVVNTSA